MAESEPPPTVQGDTPFVTSIKHPPSTPQTRKVSGFRHLSPAFFLSGKTTKDNIRNMTGHEIDYRAFEMGYNEFMSKFVKGTGDEAKETQDIQKIVKDYGEVPQVLREVGGVEALRYTPLINMIQPAWNGTGHVARNVYRWGDDSKLNMNRIPDIACYKSTDGTTPFDLPGKGEDDNTAHSRDISSTPTHSSAGVSRKDESDDVRPNQNLLSSGDGSSSTSRLPAGQQLDVGSNPFLVSSSAGTNTSQLAADKRRNRKKQQKQKKKQKQKKDAKPPEYPPFAARMDYTSCKLTIEDKTDDTRSSFDMKSGGSPSLKDFLPQGLERISARGQIGEHATIMLERQHRTHLYSVVTIGYTVRFLRWDRAGVVITEPVRFDTDITDFIRFFYRFARMTPEEQGEDGSILHPDEEDLKIFEDFKAKNVPLLVPNHQSFFHQAFVQNNDKFPIIKVHLDRLPFAPSSPDNNQPDSGKILRLLIGAPRTNTYSPFGRSTKGFIALDLDERRLKFIKDCWRYDAPTYHPELKVYERLQTQLKPPPARDSSSGLAIAEGGGDVLDSSRKIQTTVTDHYLTSRGRRKKKYLPQVHYRFVIRQVGTPLEKYDASSRNLCLRVFDALLGHGLAYEDGEVIHRDVSPDNILVDEDPEGGTRTDPRGFIHDFDLSKFRKDVNSGPAQEVRSGTWPFVSSLLLYYPTKQHELADDLESFIHIIHWFCFRFHTHNLTGNHVEIARKLSTIYFASTKINGYDVGNDEKLNHMRRGDTCFKLDEEKVNKGLCLLVKKLSDLCKEHYATIDYKALDLARNQLLGVAPKIRASSQPPVPDPTAGTAEPIRRKLALRWVSDTVKPPAQAPPVKSDVPLSTPSGSNAHPVATSSTTQVASEILQSASKGTSSPGPPVPPLSTHAKIIAAFNDLIYEAHLWPHLKDKIEDQFDTDVSKSMFLLPTAASQGGSIVQSTVQFGSITQSFGSKRSASTALEDDGPEPKRSRTSAELGVSGSSVDILQDPTPSTGWSNHHTRSRNNATRTMGLEPTIPEDPDA